jgi:hypothetical protein
MPNSLVKQNITGPWADEVGSSEGVQIKRSRTGLKIKQGEPLGFRWQLMLLLFPFLFPLFPFIPESRCLQLQ